MRPNKLDLNLLTALRALLTERHVTRAGESLCISQSAMSGILSRLRDYFDDPLIISMGRKSVLTPLAESLLEPINDILIRIETTVTQRPSFDPASSQRHFKIVASDYVVSVFLGSVLRTISRSAPGVTVDIEPQSGNVADRLEHGDVDFIISPQKLISSSHPSQVLFEDSYCVIADIANNIVGNTISLAEYFSASHVCIRNHGAQYFETWFPPEMGGDQRRIEITTDFFTLVPQLLVGTNRIATIHKRLANYYKNILPIRLVKPDFEIPVLKETLQYHQYRDLDPACYWLRSVLQDAANLLKE